MVKQKRKGPEVTKKNRKKLKVSVEETLRAADATADEEEASLEGVAASRVQDTVPQLSSEERRVLERKLKKERKKEEKKQLRDARVSTVQTPPAKRSGAELALDYLSGAGEAAIGARRQQQMPGAVYSHTTLNVPDLVRCLALWDGSRSTRAGGSRRQGRRGSC
ncbi:PREDICTED: uncharacterized protein C7orf50 homolog isoform X2 [Chinchilla lanigera]|uniref:uncharacterized protein C7orf50 homolog isoform X2 n=1 Tax=Chinchilla lanigera TaxID=34839 RepID=UPI00038EAA15|nr:PREDICTED: uncharacterized protein C7orf50 homolog isoform X2 [Chinchilla lanigera]